MALIGASRIALALLFLESAVAVHSLQLASGSALSVRNAHAMIYDSHRRVVLLFGGADATSVRGDTWQWDSGKRVWQFVTAVGPSARTFPAFAYDERRHEGILFGGNRVLFGDGSEKDSFLGDTWRFRNNQWTSVAVNGPAERAEAAVAYDRKRRRIVLFGGYRRRAGATERFGDTWEWDGHGWKRVAVDGPSPRNSAAMAYDDRLHEVILFGGPGPSNETWAWDGRRWKQLDSGNVPGRFNPVMVYDLHLQTVLRYGGWTGQSRVADTWALTAKGWQRLSSEGPPARNHSAMVYDRERGQAILFGGHDGENVFGDTWQWNGSSWTLLASVPGERSVDNGH
ncbi:MAG TPA: hypothetical protein VGI45_00570 [Terracidiphilus sp.]|jgi:hypothetical protein